MRSKILAWSKALSTMFKGRQYASKPVHCDAHMNELPVPCQPWEPWYSERQSFYSKHLAFGIIWCAFSAIMAIYTDSLYLNFFPPAQPGEPTEMADECDD